jgi:hypothetical protein
MLTFRLIKRKATILLAVVMGLTFAMHEGIAKPPNSTTEDLNENAILSLLTPKTIFVTSEKYTGNLVYAAEQIGSYEEDGLAAADYICQYHATNAGLKGNYSAIITSSTVNANARLTASLGPYRTVTGAPVAENFAMLFSTSEGFASSPDRPPILLISPIRYDENGLKISSPSPSFLKAAWTGSTPLGELPQLNPSSNTYPNVNTCFDWTVGYAATGDCKSVSTDNCGITGLATTSNTDWMRWETVGCDQMRRLYCAQR